MMATIKVIDGKTLMKKGNYSQHHYIYTEYHYGVQSKRVGQSRTVELFADEEEALERARFLLYNCDSVSVFRLENSAFRATEIYCTAVNKQLVKLAKPVDRDV